ncbi:hypothetical protein SAMN05421758_106212 [Salimicrobium salexigens]|uniref:Transposase n=1 Tax=Salimicrobium salexigens TaxID=908941 RepID=A0ABY1KVF0_9BACI|nr:hypothetical protein SAMN05421758_106212 [Salimicrobium salexigens]
MVSDECNTKWSTRKLRGFKKANPELHAMFEERYGPKNESEEGNSPSSEDHPTVLHKLIEGTYKNTNYINNILMSK